VAKHPIPVSDFGKVRVGKSVSQYFPEATAHDGMVIRYENVQVAPSRRLECPQEREL
jgi:hypothetical protein